MGSKKKEKRTIDERYVKNELINPFQFDEDINVISHDEQQFFFPQAKKRAKLKEKKEKEKEKQKIIEQFERYAAYRFPQAQRLDYRSAIRADVSKHHSSTYFGSDRSWYIDAWFDCEQCGKEFCWTANEQQVWFEEYHFWIDSCPILCLDCRRKRRRTCLIKNDYARMAKIATLRTTDLKTKQQTLYMINEIEQLSGEPLPRGIAEKRDILIRQIEKMQE